MAILVALGILFLCTMYKYAWLLLLVFVFALFFPKPAQRYKERKLKEAIQQEKDEIQNFLQEEKTPKNKVLKMNNNGISPTSHIQYEKEDKDV